MMDLHELREHLDSKFSRLELKLDKLDEKLDSHSEKIVRNETEIKWLRGYIKTGLSAVIAILTSAGTFLYHLLRH